MRKNGYDNMADTNELRIRCPNCAKETPVMNYCIYCGVKLPESVPPKLKPFSSKIPPPLPPTKQSKNMKLDKSREDEGVIGIKEEVLSLKSKIVSIYQRKVSLIQLLQCEQVSQKVFLNL